MHYGSVAISFGHTKEAALYFDSVVPVFAFAEWLDKSGQLAPWPDAYGSDLLPADLRHNNRFTEELIAVNQQAFQLTLKHWIKEFKLPQRIGGVDLTDEEFGAIDDIADRAYANLLTQYDLVRVPVITGEATVSDAVEDNADIAVALSAVRVVDTLKTSWEQIADFRRDPDARAKLRRLRLFAAENYAGKSRTYIEDDLQKRIDDYEAQIKRWGFETRNCVLSMLLTSKSLAGAASGSLISVLFGAPAIAIASAVGGAVVEIGRISIEVSRRRFALRNALRDNPISYLAQLKSLR